MSPSVLGHLTLGYQLVWNRLRKPAAVMLFMEPRDKSTVDAAHLLAALSQAWSGHSPKLILCTRSPQLLLELLQYVAPDSHWLAVEHALLADPLVVERVRSAHARGLTLLLRGAGSQRMAADIAACFALQVATSDAGPAAYGADADRIVESVASVALVEQYLDQRAALGVAGWPIEDVLRAYRQKRIEPDKSNITQLVAETEADAPLDVIEQTLSEEPVLVYRFLVHANSAAKGLRGDVDSLRHGLMMLGLSNFERWLQEQLAQASEDLNLLPVRSSLVVRARLTEQLLDAGEDDQLRSEVYLCGLLSQIDRVLGEPLSDALRRIPLSERITSAIRSKSGPYAPYLAIAGALEYANMRHVAPLCDTYQIDPGEVNRVLLKVLAHPQYLPPNSRFPG